MNKNSGFVSAETIKSTSFTGRNLRNVKHFLNKFSRDLT